MALDPNLRRALAAVAVVMLALAAATLGLVRRIGLLTRPPAASMPIARAGFVVRGPAEGRGTIAGIITGPDGAPASARVALVRSTDAARAPAPVPGRPGRGGGIGRGPGMLATVADANGRFALDHLPAGSFWLVAHAESVPAPPALATHLWGIRDVASDGHSSADVSLQLAEGGTITGLIEFASPGGTPRPDLAALSMTLTPLDARTQAQLGSADPHARPDDAGAFVIDAIAPGRYALEAAPVPGWSLDSATVDGHDGIDRPIDVSPGWGTRRARLVFSDQPNTIAGVVRHADGRPAGFVLTMAFSEDPALRQLSRRVQAARTGADGRFTFTGLPTGRYLVTTAADLSPERWYTPESFSSLAPHATGVAVGRGETKTVALQIR